MAIVTGSSSGIGQAIALELSAEGAAVVVNSRSRSRAEPVADAIVARGGRAIAVAADVRDCVQVAALVRAAVEDSEASTSSSTTPGKASSRPRRSSPRRIGGG